MNDAFIYDDTEFHFIVYFNKFNHLLRETQSMGLMYPRVIEYKIAQNQTLQSLGEEKRNVETLKYELEIIQNTLLWLEDKLAITYLSQPRESLESIYVPVLQFLREKETTLKNILKAKKQTVTPLTLAEKVLVISYLQDEGLFISTSDVTSTEQSRITDLIALLLDQDKESVKSAFQKANSTMKRKGTPSEAIEQIKSLKKISPIIDRVEQKGVLEKIAKRIQEIESYKK